MQYSTTLKNARMDAITTAIGSSGFLVIGTASLATPSTGVLAKIPLNTTAAGATVAGVLTLSQTPSALSVVAAAGGTAAVAQIWTSANAVVVSGLVVGVGTGDIQLGTTTIASGNTVAVTSATITHA